MAERYQEMMIANAGMRKAIAGAVDPLSSQLAAKANQVDLTEKTGYGVVSGLVVSAQSTPDMTVKTSAGVAYMSTGTRYAPTAVASIAVAAADATNPRIDIIYLSSAGVVSYLAGTAAASPVAPTIPTGAQLLAEIAVAAGATTINSANIKLRKKGMWTEDWIYPTLLSGWVINSTPQDVVGYCKHISGLVSFRGAIVGGTAATIPFILPVGYRPLTQKYYLARCTSGAVGSVTVLSDGSVRVDNVTGWISLSGITFVAEQ